MYKFNILQIEQFILSLYFYSEISCYKNVAELHHLTEFQTNECDLCLRWTDWISLGDASYLSRTPNTYTDLVNLGKHAAGYDAIDTCALPVSSDCRILVVDDRDQNAQYLACPYVKHDNGTEVGWAQMRFLCWDHTCPCLEWSSWYNYDGPRDDGDIEILGKTIPREDWPCSYGTGMLDVECRTTDGRSMTETKNRMLQCDLDGFQCLNDLQDENCVCQDFMVRFLCLHYDQKAESLDFESNLRMDEAPVKQDEVHYPRPPPNIYGYGKCVSVIILGNRTTTSTHSSQMEGGAAAVPETTTTISSNRSSENATEEFYSVGDGKPTSSTKNTTEYVLDIRHLDPVVEEAGLFNRQKIEILKTDDGKELIIEAVPSKAAKPKVHVVTKVPTLPTQPREGGDSPRPRYSPPVYRRPPPYLHRRPWHTFPPMEWSYWGRSTEERFPSDPRNYGVAPYSNEHYDPRTGHYTRYGASNSHSEQEHGRRWLYPARRQYGRPSGY